MAAVVIDCFNAMLSMHFNFMSIKFSLYHHQFSTQDTLQDNRFSSDQEMHIPLTVIKWTDSNSLTKTPI